MVSGMMEAVTDWKTEGDGRAWRGVILPPTPPPDRGFYEDLYREALGHLHSGEPLTKNLRKHWRKQLVTARACLRSYFGATPPRMGAD